MAQRAAGGVAGREERGRHAHAVRAPQRHVGDGAGAAGRRGRDPPASGGGGISAAGRGRRTSWTSCPSSRAGSEARDAIEAYLDTYGMRCVGEIDITRPRWSERPTTLVPLILGNIKNFEPGAGSAALRARAAGGLERKEQELLERLRALAGRGAEGRREPKRMIDRVRTFAGYREYPKYGIGQPLLRLQAGPAGRGRAPRAGRRASREGGHLLPHVRGAPGGRAHEPRGRPAHPRSARTRSGRTRRSRRPGCSPRTARPSPGRTGATTCRPARWSACRSPPGPSRGGPASSWTWRRPISKRATSWSRPTRTPAGRRCSSPITGLVTEVGGLMTHGAVIAREYGLPAVVGVEHATRLIPDRAADSRARNRRVRRDLVTGTR